MGAEIKTAIVLRDLPVPEFAEMHVSQPNSTYPVVALCGISNDAFNNLVDRWVSQMYRQHKQNRPAQAASQ